MCGSMADIQSATAEIRRGKKEDRTRTPGQQCRSFDRSLPRAGSQPNLDPNAEASLLYAGPMC